MISVEKLIHIFGVRRQDSPRKRKEEVSIFFYVAWCLIFKLVYHVSDKTRNCCDLDSFNLHMQITFLAITQQKFIWSLEKELSGIRPKTVVVSKQLPGRRMWHD